MGYKEGFTGIPEERWKSVYGERGKIPNSSGDVGEFTRLFTEIVRQMDQGGVCAQMMRERVATVLGEEMKRSSEHLFMNRALEQAKKSGPFEYAMALLAWSACVDMLQPIAETVLTLYDQIKPERYVNMTPGEQQAKILINLLLRIPLEIKNPEQKRILDAVTERMDVLIDATNLGGDIFDLYIGEVIARFGPQVYDRLGKAMDRGSGPWQNLLADVGMLAHEARVHQTKDAAITGKLWGIFDRMLKKNSDMSSETCLKYWLRMPKLCEAMGSAAVASLRNLLERFVRSWSPEHAFAFSARCATHFPGDDPFVNMAIHYVNLAKDDPDKFGRFYNEAQRDRTFAECYLAFGGEWLEEQLRKNMIRFGRGIAYEKNLDAWDEVVLLFLEGLLKHKKLADARIFVYQLRGADSLIRAFHLIEKASAA